MAYLRSKLGDEDILLVDVVPLCSVSLEVVGLDVVPVNGNAVELNSRPLA